MSKFVDGLPRTAANYQPLTPIDFLLRAETVFPAQPAVIHGDDIYTYRQFGERCRRLADALRKRGIGKGDTVAIMAPNVPALLDAHFGVPGCGAVLNALNIRLDAATVAFILEHARAKIFIVDRAFSRVASQAIGQLDRDLTIIDIDDEANASGESLGPRIGEMTYEGLLHEGDPNHPLDLPDDEWQAIALNYTSGTTGNPKGVVSGHRGTYLNAIGDLTAYSLPRHAVYLWTLPMFHCNGWCFTWAITAAMGTHVCLRRVEPSQIFEAAAKHAVTHLCGAPIVLNMLVHAPVELRRPLPKKATVITGGAAPPSAVIQGMEGLGFNVVHAYGLTETHGPSVTCFAQPEWEDLDLQNRALKNARQGWFNLGITDMAVMNPETMEEMPADGETVGELMLKGHTIMEGYLKNGRATDESFRGGWFHTGDLVVRHPDGYVEVKDRSKDIIISGGENISSLEVEETLYRHPAIMEAAVVAKPDEKWGETPCAFIALKPGAETTSQDVISYCRDHMAHYKAPRHVVFGPLPKTPTGKIQKFMLREQAKEIGA